MPPNAAKLGVRSPASLQPKVVASFCLTIGSRMPKTVSQTMHLYSGTHATTNDVAKPRASTLRWRANPMLLPVQYVEGLIETRQNDPFQVQCMRSKLE